MKYLWILLQLIVISRFLAVVHQSRNKREREWLFKEYFHAKAQQKRTKACFAGDDQVKRIDKPHPPSRIKARWLVKIGGNKARLKPSMTTR